jgi:hypothetical protein
MDLRKTIFSEHSKFTCTRIVNWVKDDPQKFKDLFTCFLSDEPLLAQRAAWPLSYIVTGHPRLMDPYFPKMLRNLKKPGIHDSIKRNSMRFLQHISIPEKYQGEIMDTAFNYINSPSEKPAIKAFALSVLQNLSRQYPEIIPELKMVIENQWDLEGAAFKSRAKKILKEIGG